MPFYFAYGSNMDRAAMARRCPRSTSAGPGRLHGYRFFVSQRGYASVRREPGAVVHGLCWRLALGDVAALDRYEDVGGGLYVKAALPVHTGEGIRQALVYLGDCLAPGVPLTGYMEAVVAAAKDCGLPEPHIRELCRWLPRPGSNLPQRASLR